jgi:hypothetical protein
VICDPWVQRAPVVEAPPPPAPPKPPRQYKTPKADRDALREQRRIMREVLKVCINGPMHGGMSQRGILHGPVVSKCGRCQRCLDVKNGVTS